MTRSVAPRWRCRSWLMAPIQSAIGLAVNRQSRDFIRASTSVVRRWVIVPSRARCKLRGSSCSRGGLANRGAVGEVIPLGLSNHEDSEEICFDEIPITRTQMKRVLDNFYERSLRTPALVIEGHAKRVWKESEKGVPESRPEEIIQGRLLEALKAVFARHDLRAEPVTDDGRADIVISMRALTSGGLPAVINEWVLELKALADRTTTGNTVAPSNVTQAIQSGLEQAVGYKTQLNALNAALCCYDMRVSDCGDEAAFTHIRDDAEFHDIPLWRWFLFRSTAASRGARVTLVPREGEERLHELGPTALLGRSAHRPERLLAHDRKSPLLRKFT